MSTARPIGLYRRLDNYSRQNGGDDKPLTSAQDRRRIHKERHETKSGAGVWIYASRAKNKPTTHGPSACSS